MKIRLYEVLNIVATSLLIFLTCYYINAESFGTTSVIMKNVAIFILYPTIFLLHGLATALLKGNPFTTILTVALTYILILVILEQTHMQTYGAPYILLAVLGYGTYDAFQRRKQQEAEGRTKEKNK